MLICEGFSTCAKALVAETATATNKANAKNTFFETNELYIFCLLL
jgi:hypothetical protein